MTIAMIMLLLVQGPEPAEPPPWPAESWAQVDRARYDGEGRLVDCATEVLGPVPAANGSFCEHAGAIPPAIFALMRGPAGKPFTIVADMNLAIDGRPAYPSAYETTTGKVTSVSAARFAIGASGTIEDCTSVEKRGPEQLVPSVCNVVGRFDTASYGRNATMRVAFSLE